MLCDLKIWSMALKNNRARLPCHFKLFASFHSHLWIQTGVTVQNSQFMWKVVFVFCVMTLKFERWPWQMIKHLFFHATSSFVHHFVKMKLWSRNTHIKTKFVLTSVNLAFDLNLLHEHHFVNGNDFWKFHDEMMKRTLRKRCDRRTDRWTNRRTDRAIHRAAWLHLKKVTATTHNNWPCLWLSFQEWQVHPQSVTAERERERERERAANHFSTAWSDY